MVITKKALAIQTLFMLLVKDTSAMVKNLVDKAKMFEEHTLVTDSKTFPYVVAILKKATYISAGALIDESWVITAANSLYTIRESSRTLRVRLGSVNYKKGGHLTPIKYLQIHPYFDDHKPLFDVALVKLSDPVRFTQSLNPIRLQKSSRNIVATHFIVTAWPMYQAKQNLSKGYQNTMEQIKRRRILTVSHLHPTDPAICSEEKDILIPDHNNTKSVMCLDPNIGTDSCQRDIGAPVVLNGILWGIISSWKPDDCDVEGGPTFVTLVSAVEVSSWIHSTIRGHRWTTKHTVDYVDNFI
ncbi:chymotrypsin-1 [Bicyclus anynana]|uniref:Chymotrypsin-1 n=1 Tax=Bicyclus anynana TaxID=110368 RepID=A0ABM3LX84_BICAN|nr:chymotrypsin-1 [Bicyclus anynana]